MSKDGQKRLPTCMYARLKVGVIDGNDFEAQKHSLFCLVLTEELTDRNALIAQPIYIEAQSKGYCMVVDFLYIWSFLFPPLKFT